MRARAVIGLLLSAVLLVACGGGAEAPVTLRVIMADDWADTAPVLDVVRDFEADHPGVTISLVGRPFAQIGGDVTAGIAAGQPLDVVHGHAFASAAQGLAEPIDDLWAEHLDPDDYFPGAIDDVRWDGSYVGVPLDINAMVLILDEDLAQAHGLPATFGDMAELSRAAVDEGRRGIAITASSWRAYAWIRANGGEVVELAEDGTPTFTFDRPENIEAMDFLAGLIADELAYGPTTRNVSTDAFALFSSGETAMHASGTWDTAALDEIAPDRGYVTTIVPGGIDGDTQGSALGGSSLFVGRDSAHRELAFQFMLALTADDVALALAAQEGRMPPRPDVLARTDLPAPVLETLQAQLVTASPQLSVAFPGPQEAFSQAVDDILGGRASAAEALGAAQAVAVGADAPSSEDPTSR